jgi:uncharacterized protein (DUF488 family)
MNSPIPIYTIGYGNRTLEQFIALLKQYEIAFVADVRSQPYSRHNNDFSKHDLAAHLKQHNIRYIFMGDTLGGRPQDSSCYDSEGRVDYSKLREKAFYQEGIQRLPTAWEKQLHVAIMCTEIRPDECHRGKLIGNTLFEQQIDVQHIDETGALLDQQEVNKRLNGKPPTIQYSFFKEVVPLTNDKMSFSSKKYSKKEDV